MDKRLRDQEHAKMAAERLADEVAEFRDRLVFLCDDLAPGRGKYAYLEARTGVPASKWKNLYLDRQMPTIEMIIGIVKHRLPYGKWLITGQAGSKDELGLFGDREPKPEAWTQFTSHRQWIRNKRENGDQEEQ